MSSKRLERRFVNSDQIDSQLFCSICSDVFLDPTRLLCGHIFCRKCITHWLHDKKSCPVCRKHTEESNMERDSRTNCIIDELEVHCPNSECTWKDKLLNLNKHYNSECDFTKNPEWLSQNQNYIQIEEDNINIPLEKTLGFYMNKTAQIPWLIRMEPAFGPHVQAPLVPMGFPIFLEECYHRCPMYKVFAERWQGFEMKDKNMSMEILGSYFGEFSRGVHHLAPEEEIIIDENTTDESLQNKNTKKGARKRNTKKNEGKKEEKKTRKKRESRSTSTEKKKSENKKGKRALVRHIVLDEDEEMFKDELQKKIKDTTVVL